MYWLVQLLASRFIAFAYLLALGKRMSIMKGRQGREVENHVMERKILTSID